MRLRILASIVLMIGFYVLAISIAALFLGGIYVTVRAGHIYPRLIIFGGLAAVMILWSILPRFDRFTAPGPQLTDDAQPEVLGMIRGVATETAQEMPHEVYLIPNVNAYVAYRGGWMGFGSRRVLGVGLPLLQALSVSQLRAVIAHEFGHYAGGDLKMAGWIYKTRAAMGRTIENLARVGSSMNRPFVMYGNFFMRVTQVIARAQEIAADRMAVRVAGARSHANALRIVEGAAAAYDAYWTSEVIPILSNGYRPPLGAGFAQFMTAVAKGVDAAVENAMKKDADPYDSHPSLRERLAAIGDIPDISPLHDDPPAITLVRDLPRVEHALLRTLTNDPAEADKLEAIQWSDAASRVYLPNCASRRVALLPAIGEATFADVPSLLTSSEVAKVLGTTDAKPEDREAQHRGVLSSVTAAALAENGWTCTTAPGTPLVFTKEGRRFEPFTAIIAGDDAWRDAIREAGIEEMRLSP